MHYVNAQGKHESRNDMSYFVNLFISFHSGCVHTKQLLSQIISLSHFLSTSVSVPSFPVCLSFPVFQQVVDC